MVMSKKIEFSIRFLSVFGFCLLGIVLSGCAKESADDGVGVSAGNRAQSISFDELSCPIGPEVPAPKPSRFHQLEVPYMVYTAAGDQHNLKMWFSCGVPAFKLYVSFYGKDPDVQNELEDIVGSQNGLFESNMQGFKDNMFYAGWKISKNSTHPYHVRYRRFFHGVKYFTLVDDDLTFSANKFNLFFLVNTQMNLCYSSASLTPGLATTWVSNQHVSESLFRAGAFVETGLKTFRRDCLDAFMESYFPELLGWGAEHVAFSVLLDQGFLNETNHGVVDVVEVSNPPVRSNGKREQSLVGSGEAEYEAFLKSHPGIVNERYIASKYSPWRSVGYCDTKIPIPSWVQDQLNQSHCSE